MTIAELEAELPNGFHDSYVRSIAVDYQAGTATFEIDVWVGEVDAPSEAGRERMRPARLELSSIRYLALDVPDASRPPGGGPLWIDLCQADPARQPPELVPPGEFAGRFFVNQWNAFILFAAANARLDWLDRSS